MLKARQGKEIVIRMANEIGTLARLSKKISEKGIDLLAMSCWVENDEAVIRLVTDDMQRTEDVLREGGHNPQVRDVVMVDAAHKPGILRHLSDTLAHEGINLSHLFASATIDQEHCLVVLNSSNNERAIVLLND